VVLLERARGTTCVVEGGRWVGVSEWVEDDEGEQGGKDTRSKAPHDHSLP